MAFDLDRHRDQPSMPDTAFRDDVLGETTVRQAREGVDAQFRHAHNLCDGSLRGLKREHGEAVTPKPWLPPQL